MKAGISLATMLILNRHVQLSKIQGESFPVKKTDLFMPEDLKKVVAQLSLLFRRQLRYVTNLAGNYKLG